MSTLCKRAIPHTVKVAKSLEADVLEDGGGRLCGEGNKFSEDIMGYIEQRKKNSAMNFSCWF